MEVNQTSVQKLAESLRLTEGFAATKSLGSGSPLRTADLDSIIKIATDTCGIADFVGWDGEVGEGRKDGSGSGSMVAAAAAAAKATVTKKEGKEEEKDKSKEKTGEKAALAVQKEKSADKEVVDYFPSTDFNELD